MHGPCRFKALGASRLPLIHVHDQVGSGKTLVNKQGHLEDILDRDISGHKGKLLALFIPEHTRPSPRFVFGNVQVRRGRGFVINSDQLLRVVALEFVKDSGLLVCIGNAQADQALILVLINGVGNLPQLVHHPNGYIAVEGNGLAQNRNAFSMLHYGAKGVQFGTESPQGFIVGVHSFTHFDDFIVHIHRGRDLFRIIAEVGQEFLRARQSILSVFQLGRRIFHLARYRLTGLFQESDLGVKLFDHLINGLLGLLDGVLGGGNALVHGLVLVTALLVGLLLGRRRPPPPITWRCVPQAQKHHCRKHEDKEKRKRRQPQDEEETLASSVFTFTAGAKAIRSLPFHS